MFAKCPNCQATIQHGFQTCPECDHRVSAEQQKELQATLGKSVARFATLSILLASALLYLAYKLLG